MPPVVRDPSHEHGQKRRVDRDGHVALHRLHSDLLPSILLLCPPSLLLAILLVTITVVSTLPVAQKRRHELRPR